MRPRRVTREAPIYGQLNYLKNYSDLDKNPCVINILKLCKTFVFRINLIYI